MGVTTVIEVNIPLSRQRKERFTHTDIDLINSKVRNESRPFAEGGMRLAYKATVICGNFNGYAKGTSMVMKLIKPELYNLGLRLTEHDILAQELTQTLCDKFNKKAMTKKLLFSRVGMLVKADNTYKDSAGNSYILKGEEMLYEEMIAGEYAKFNSNNGWSDETYNLPNFFSHWSWVHSGGKYIVCDLQGHRGRPGGPLFRTENGSISNYYLFTDPVVMTSGEGLELGFTDLGMNGIHDWFEQHRCNKLCKKYGLTTKRPGRKTGTSRTYTVGMGTSYTIGE